MKSVVLYPNFICRRGNDSKVHENLCVDPHPLSVSWQAFGTLTNLQKRIKQQRGSKMNKAKEGTIYLADHLPELQSLSKAAVVWLSALYQPRRERWRTTTKRLAHQCRSKSTYIARIMTTNYQKHQILWHRSIKDRPRDQNVLGTRN